MRTEDLIEALAKDTGNMPESVERRFGLLAGAGIVIAAFLFYLILGMRSDAMEAMQTPWYPLKMVITGLLALLTIPVVTALARPGAAVPAKRLAIVGVLLAAAIAADLLMLDPTAWKARMMGQNAMFCLTLIPVFSVAPLVAVVIALRHGASPRPMLSGFAAGVLSGAVGGFLYGLFCPDDSPLFLAVWYTIAIVIVSAVGALAGRFALRW